MKPVTKSLSERNYPIITAHSGCEGTPDNSLEHIQSRYCQRRGMP